MNVQVHGAGNAPQFLQQIVRKFPIGSGIEAYDLYVDRGGQAEIQDLANHVRRQKRELRGRIGGGKLLAQQTHELHRRLVVLAQVDVDVRITRTHRRRGAVREVDAAVGQSQVIDDAGDLFRWNDLANRGLNLIAKRGGLFDAGTGPRPHVQFDLAAIDGGEKILTQARQGPERKG